MFEIPGPHQDKRSSMAHLVGIVDSSAVTHATDAQMAYALQPKELEKISGPRFVWSWLNCSREGRSEQAKKGLVNRVLLVDVS